jgi:hypothetical protein
VSKLDEYLKRLTRCGDHALAAQRAGVSDEQLNQWYNDPNASNGAGFVKCFTYRHAVHFQRIE